MIRFENVAKRYPSGHEALNELSFELERGEMAFVTGHSGAGKSTLLKLIALVERPSRGQVTVDGQNLAHTRRRGIAPLRRRIGMVFQDHRLLLDRSVFDNVALPLVIAGVAREEIGKRVRASLDKVGLLGREGDAPVALSTGEQQRVGIARAIVAKPPVLIADEPTGNLDPRLSSGLRRMNRKAPKNRLKASAPPPKAVARAARAPRIGLRAWREQHLYSLFSSLGRIAARPLATLLTLLVMALALAMPLLLFVLLDNAQQLRGDMQQAGAISVFLKPNQDAAVAEALAKRLRARAGVASVTVKTPEQGLQEFRSQSGFADAMKVLHENPLPAVLVVTPRADADAPAQLA